MGSRSYAEHHAVLAQFTPLRSASLALCGALLVAEPSPRAGA